MTTATPSVLPPTRPAPPRGLAQRLRWLAADTWTLTRREVIRFTQQPAEVVGLLVFPVVVVLLFGYVFGSAMTVAGGGDYRSFLMPGLFAMTMGFALANTAVAVVNDTSRGVMDRFRSLPMSPGALLTGRLVADGLAAVVDLVLLVGLALVVGWRATGGLGATLLAIVLLLWLRIAMTWIGILLGLVLPTPEAAMRSFGLVLPLTMFSNAFVSPELMPAWLGTVAEWNPLSSTVAATRELFGNPGVVGGSWIVDHALEMAIAWPALIMVVVAPLALRRFARLSH